jgi:hypothetical protein
VMGLQMVKVYERGMEPRILHIGEEVML